MNPKSILLIDADVDSLEIYSAMLRHLGYKVATARDQEQALQTARVDLPDLIFTELFERTALGWKPLDVLREDPVVRGVPVVALTSRVLEDDRARAKAAGCIRFLMKPLQPSELAIVVDDLFADARNVPFPRT